MRKQFRSISVDDLLVDEPLPATIYINIESRFITFRAAGDTITQTTFDRLHFKSVTSLFVAEEDHAKMVQWGRSWPPASEGPPGAQAKKEFVNAWKDTHRSLMDIFQGGNLEEGVTQTLKASRTLVAEVMKSPYAVKSLSHLQTFSRGTVDHSMNVSVLSVYLALQMGYTHTLILQNLGLGGLLHDLGKSKVEITDQDTPEEAEAKLRTHPTVGATMLELLDGVPSEVKLIVAQHHEFHDGTGYPRRLHGSSIYDLARIVSLANVFDHLVHDARGTLAEKQKKAIEKLDERYFPKFEPDKHDKAINILRKGV